MKDSFIIYKSFYEPIKHLTLEEKGLLLDAIFGYQINREEPKIPSGLKIAFGFFKNQFCIDDEKYEKIVERNRSNGSLGGRPKGKKKETEENPKNPDGYLKTQGKLNDNDNDNDNDLGSINLNVKKEEAGSNFPPFLSEIKNTFKSHGVDIKIDVKSSQALNSLLSKYSDVDIISTLKKSLVNPELSGKLKNNTWGLCNFIERFEYLKQKVFLQPAYNRPVPLKPGAPIPNHIKEKMKRGRNTS